MAEKYNLKDELLKADDSLTGSSSLLGMTMLTQPQYNNSMRSVMFTSHLKQFVNLLNPDFAGFFTNGENVVGKNSSGYKKAKGDLEIVRKIEKYGDIIDNPFVYVLFVYNRKTKEYDIITRKEIENLTEVFAYTFNNETIDSFEEGDVINEGTILYKSSSYDKYMNYGYGKNVPIMYTAEPFTSEDACVCARSLCEEMSSIEGDTVSIGINQNDVLLNLYGDEYVYKPFPDLGEFARGEVAYKRTLFTNQFLTDLADSALSRPEDSDVPFYYDGQVIDIDVYCNNPELPRNDFNEQIWKYLDSQTRYYEEIKETCEMIFDTGKKFSHNLDYLYKRACEFLDEEKGWKDNNSVFGNLRIEITLKKKVGLTVGQKLTG